MVEVYDSNIHLQIKLFKKWGYYKLKGVKETKYIYKYKRERNRKGS